jgi:hypothetical protein
LFLLAAPLSPNIDPVPNLESSPLNKSFLIVLYKNKILHFPSSPPDVEESSERPCPTPTANDLASFASYLLSLVAGSERLGLHRTASSASTSTSANQDLARVARPFRWKSLTNITSLGGYLPPLPSIRTPVWSNKESSKLKASQTKEEGGSLDSDATKPELERSVDADELADALAGPASDDQRAAGNDDHAGSSRSDSDSDSEDDVGEHIKRLASEASSQKGSLRGGCSIEDSATPPAQSQPRHKSIKIFVGEGSSAGWAEAIWLQVRR